MVRLVVIVLWRMVATVCIMACIHLITVKGTCGQIGRDGKIDKNHRTNASVLSDIFKAVMVSYDKKFRPNFGGPSTNITLDLHVLSFADLEEGSMAYGLDFYFAQMWRDQRFISKNHRNCVINMIGKEVEKVWLPDTVFVNSKSSKFHDVTVNNRFLSINMDDGSVMYHIRISTTASCRLNLRYYPFDKQTCVLAIESYGSDSSDVVYNWNNLCSATNNDSMCNKIFVYDTELSNFDVLSAKKSQNRTTYHAPKYRGISGATAHFSFKRRYNYFMLQVFLPCSLIVCVSWTSFWISPTAIPARSSICVTTILTLITMLGIVNNNMPKVSYVKAIDMYLLTSFLFVFSSLLEFIVVLNISWKCVGRLAFWKRNKTWTVKKSDRNYQQLEEEHKIAVKRKEIQLEREQLYLVEAEVGMNVTRRHTQVHHHDHCGNKRKKDKTVSINVQNLDCEESDKMNNLGESIDVISRGLFPILYFLFNAGYWTYLLVRDHL